MNTTMQLIDELADAKRVVSILTVALERIYALCDEDSEEQEEERKLPRLLKASGVMSDDTPMAQVELDFIIEAIKETAATALNRTEPPPLCEAVALTGNPCLAKATYWMPASGDGSGRWFDLCEEHVPPELRDKGE